MLTDAKGKDIWTVFRYTQPRKSQLSPPLTKDGGEHGWGRVWKQGPPE